MSDVKASGNHSVTLTKKYLYYLIPCRFGSNAKNFGCGLLISLKAIPINSNIDRKLSPS